MSGGPPFTIAFTPEADAVRLELKESKQYKAKYRKLLKALKNLSLDPRHPGLHTHKYKTVKAPDDGDVWQSYIENNTPGAWRIWWYYGPEEGMITIYTIMQHP